MKIHYVRLSKEANDERLVVVAIKKRKQRRPTKKKERAAKKKTKPKENEGATNPTTNLLKYLHILINGI